MLEIFTDAALKAGSAIMDVFRSGPEVRFKADQSPVTLADERAEEIIVAILKTAFPDVPVVAEEAAAAGSLPDISSGRFILVDPLDGTKEFVNKREDFTVNIALVEDGVPLAGVVYAPARQVLYRGEGPFAEKLTIDESGKVSSRTAISTRLCGNKPVAVASRSHNNPETAAFLEEQGIGDVCSVGSSLKFCLVAEGLADVYPRFGRTMEWDTAAGDAVLRAAGGKTLTADGHPLRYGKRDQALDVDFANPPFISWGRTAI